MPNLKHNQYRCLSAMWICDLITTKLFELGIAILKLKKNARIYKHERHNSEQHNHIR